MEKYLDPEMEIIEFAAEDIITTSSLVEGGDMPSGDGEGGNPEFPPF